MKSVVSNHATDTADLVGQVADEFLKAVELGQQPNVDQYAARYPEIAAILRDVLPALTLMNPSVSRDESQGPAAEDLTDKTLGDFRLVREIGRGGMGVVYEAEQISLGRTVALKVLPFASMLDSRQLARFRNEARAAAVLHHTNIVPVYSVGCERSVHFYAMQYIEGESLARLIAQLRRQDGQSEVTSRRASAPGDRMAEVGGLKSDVGVSRGTCAVESHAGSPPDAGSPASDDAPTTDWSPHSSPSPLTGEGLSAVSLSNGGEGAALPTTPPADSGSQANRLTEPPPIADLRPPTSAAPDTTPVAHAFLSTARSTSNKTYFRNIAELGIQAAEALDYAHEQGVIHRDIKPANLLLDETGRLWIADFGLARLETDAGMTMTGDLVGTLRYMSPEQALAKRVVVDHRTDIYSLGVTLYELLTLRAVFEGEDRQHLLRQIAFDDPRPLRKLNRQIPVELETIVLKALRKNPTDRYATARDLAEDLRSFLQNKPIKAKPPTRREKLVKWSQRHPATLLSTTIIAATVAIVLSVAALVINGAKRVPSQ